MAMRVVIFSMLYFMTLNKICHHSFVFLSIYINTLVLWPFASKKTVFCWSLSRMHSYSNFVKKISIIGGWFCSKCCIFFKPFFLQKKKNDHESNMLLTKTHYNIHVKNNLFSLYFSSKTQFSQCNFLKKMFIRTGWFSYEFCLFLDFFGEFQ